MNTNKKPNLSRLVLWCVIGLFGFMLLSSLMSSGSSGPKDVGSMQESVLYHTLTSKPQAVSKLIFNGTEVDVYSSSSQYQTVNVPDESDRTNIRELAVSKHVAFNTDANSSGGLLDDILDFSPYLLLIALFLFLPRMMGKNAGALQGLLKGRSRLVEDVSGVTFADVIGQAEAKEDLAEIVYMLRDPLKAKQEGIDIPSGVLLEGPPGTGKTLLARAVAGEAGVPFYSMSGSDFVEMFVGMGAARVRDVFKDARAHGRAIVFIDEIDAVGRRRGSGLGNGHDEREQTLNQILTEMDGFDTKVNGSYVLVIAATNRADVLDPALLRPGRLTRRTQVELPMVDDREQLFRYYIQKNAAVTLSPQVDLRVLANTTTGMSGADVSNVVNEARVFRMRRIQSGVDQDTQLLDADFDKAISKVKYGAERKSMIRTAEDNRKTAVHEAGHGTVAYFLLGPDHVRKATVIPTGRALGYFEWLYDGHKTNYSERDVLDIITIAVAGRVSQEHFLGADQKDSGVASDYQQAWTLARRAVAEWGMSERLGIICAPLQEMQFLGDAMMHHDAISEDLRKQIEDECRAMITRCEGDARRLIAEHEEAMRVLFDTLVEKETLLGGEIRAILGS